VADGVSEWSERFNIDAGKFSRNLLKACQTVIESAVEINQVVSPLSILSEAWKVVTSDTVGLWVCVLLYQFVVLSPG